MKEELLDELVEGIYTIFAEGAKLDWPVRPQLLAKIRSRIIRYLSAQNYADEAQRKEVAGQILTESINQSDFIAAD